MVWALSRTRFRLWALLGATCALACQFPDYDRKEASTEAGGALGSGNASNGGVPPDAGSGGAVTAGIGNGNASGAGSSAGGNSAGGADGDPSGGGEGGATVDPGDWLSDDFESGNAAQWLELAGSPWVVVTDTERQSQGYQVFPTFPGFYAAVAKDGPWTDQIFEADVKVLAFGGVGTGDVVSLLGRFGNIDNYYALALRPDRRLAIRARVGGTPPASIKTSADFGITTGIWYRLRFELVGNSLKAFVDGILRAEVQDDRLAKGTVALAGTNSAALFDNVRVSAP